MLGEFAPKPGRLLDPFGGAGAALFASRDLGWDATGIELLPVGIFVIEARQAVERVSRQAFRAAVDRFAASDWKRHSDPELGFRHLTITRDAFADATEREITSYRTYVRDEMNVPDLRLLFEAACFAVLESVSFTRKDGQYLRWDERSRRDLKGKPFNKGPIPGFSQAVMAQLRTMLADMHASDLFGRPGGAERGQIETHQGSCLTMLTEFQPASFDMVVTSPPYCNRYDYTRTYALELAYLGVGQSRLKELRQALLSCTVENRAKVDELRTHHAGTGNLDLFERALVAFEEQEALQEVLARLEEHSREGRLNNTNVPRMVRNYFLESAIVIFELARLLRPGGRVVMVNDNVQYAGDEVPVDLILCDLAARAGMMTEHIWTLGRGKGNSSQQMGAHGRNELRKCAYVWRSLH
ncbi:MAG TPA: hypothetical protein VMV69_00410 [Pirellulales bacterium]|nr:hypothetical protein [Pirellulales bacterium]